MNKTANFSNAKPFPPRVFFFAPKRWRVGLIHAVESLFLLAAGGFLLLEIHTVPNLKLQMFIMGFGMLIGGIALARIAFIDFLGFLRVDEEGIHLRKRPQCESFSWDRITSWSIGNATNSYDFGRFLEFSVAGDAKSPHTVDGKYLRTEQFIDILDLLSRYQRQPDSPTLLSSND